MPPLQQTAFSYDDLIACAKGELFGPETPIADAADADVRPDHGNLG
ncbi:MAG: hypothetical protein CM15mP115_15090 [Alphaproteobacteria bacterium]|nr:MAG: hypothetical protein CM15mP115_15090 [Alphaproteobacteria bacterium]